MPNSRRIGRNAKARVGHPNQILPSWEDVLTAGFPSIEAAVERGEDPESWPADVKLDLRRELQAELVCRRVFQVVTRICWRLQGGERITDALRHERVVAKTYYRWLRRYMNNGLARMVMSAQSGKFHGEPASHWNHLQREHRRKVEAFARQRREEMARSASEIQDQTRTPEAHV